MWDASTVAVLDAIETKYVALGKSVEIVGMHKSSQRMLGRLSGDLSEADLAPASQSLVAVAVRPIRVASNYDGHSG